MKKRVWWRRWRLALGERVGVDAGIRDTGGDLLGLVASVVALVLDADLLDIGGAGVGDGGSCEIVLGVGDPDEEKGDLLSP